MDMPLGFELYRCTGNDRLHYIWPHYPSQGTSPQYKNQLSYSSGDIRTLPLLIFCGTVGWTDHAPFLTDASPSFAWDNFLSVIEESGVPSPTMLFGP